MRLNENIYKSMIIAAIFIAVAGKPTYSLADFPDVSKHHADALKSQSSIEYLYKNSIQQRQKRILDSLLTANFAPVVSEIQPINDGIRYVMSNGKRIERTGGTIAWRNNNPGCIRYSSGAVAMGAVGKANGFAVFPDEQTGMNAIATLLKSESYRDLTIAKAIHRYAPPHENDTRNYISKLCRATGLNQESKISDLNNAQLTKVVKTIRKIEGWRPGNEVVISPDFALNLDPISTQFDNIKQFSHRFRPEKTL